MKNVFSFFFVLIAMFTLQSQSCKSKKANTEQQKDSISTAMLVDAEKEIAAMRAADSARIADSIALAQQDRKHPPALPLEPRYKEGREALQKFLAANVKYPEAARKKDIKGIVYVDFVVMQDGSLKDFKVRQGLGYGCDEEALRVAKLMPAWEPGKKDGKTVDMEYNIAVKFGVE
ncbi:MAG: TonB family protein [Bacteroidetes bacterium]|nr:MAG: TonB family protein [Bacteroidota bacterium]